MKKIILFIIAANVMFANVAFCIGETGTAEQIKKYYAQGDVFYNKAQYSEAIKYYTAAVKLKDDFIDGWKKIGFCYYKIENHKYAYYGFQKVLQYDKNDKDALEFMGFYNSVILKAKKKNEKRDWVQPVWRSALLPGWGQAYNNQFLKGIVFGTGYIVSGAMLVYNVADEKNKYAKYLSTNENQDIAYKAAEDAYTLAIVWAGVTAAFWLGAMIDGGLNYNCEEANDMAVRPKIEGLVFAAEVFKIRF